MSGRIVLFGATGYTGRLTAAALVRRGARPVLAGRNPDALAALAEQSGGGLETAVADVADPASVRALVETGDVLVTTVGPFTTYGEPAVRAAIDTGASYLDSTGEPGFIRRVWERWGPEADVAGTALVTAFGYDYVPGNVAGALALRRAGQAAVRVDVGYFFTGKGSMSHGTLSSLVASGGEPGFHFRDGRLVEEREARSVRSFDVRGKQSDAVSLGTSDHFTLPRLAPWLREVNAYLGWFGPLSRGVQAASAVAEKVPGVEAAMRAFLKAMPKPPPGGGPDEASRQASGSYVVAIAYDGTGAPLAEIRLAGVNGYDFTAEILAWGAIEAAAHGLRGTGAVGPVEAFGLDEMVTGVGSAGLPVVT